jgi:DNA-binding NarL/FixJ family response regulator
VAGASGAAAARPAAARPAAARSAAARPRAAARPAATLRAAASAVVRQRPTPGRVRSVALWNAFWTGDWFLVDHFDDDGRRFLVARRYGRSGRQGLSSRQWQVAVLVAGGYANKQIAHELGLAESTVATYLAQAMAKLGVRSRMELPRLLPLERRRVVR